MVDGGWWMVDGRCWMDIKQYTMSTGNNGISLGEISSFLSFLLTCFLCFTLLCFFLYFFLESLFVFGERAIQGLTTNGNITLHQQLLQS